MKQNRYFMTQVLLILLLSSPLFMFPVAALAENPTNARERMEAAVARQAAAIKAMKPAISRQSGSIQHQLKTQSANVFFTLPAIPRTVAPPSGQMPPCEALPVEEIDSLVGSVSRREGVEPELIRSVIKEESGFRACAVSRKGAMGLMQLMPETAADFSVTDPFDPEANVSAGTRLLHQLLQHYGGDLSLALSAYNAGPRRVDAEMGIPAIFETQNYVQRILAMLPMQQKRMLSFDSDSDGDQ